MKTKTFLTTILTLLLTMNTTIKAQPGDNPKILVVYYSWSPDGNTRAMAEMIKERTGADIFEVIPVDAYPTDYNKCVNQAKDEINRNHRPAIKSNVENISDYDIVFVGSPCWWSTIAPPLATLLSGLDLKGKTVLPFMTHEGSRLGRSVADIEKLCPGATVLPGLAIRGGNVRSDAAGSDIDKWLRDNGVIK